MSFDHLRSHPNIVFRTPQGKSPEAQYDDEVEFSVFRRKNLPFKQRGLCCGPGKLRRFSDWLRAGRSGDRIPVGDEVFRTCPDRPWGPPSLLYKGTASAAGVKRPERGVDHIPHLAPRLKKE